MKTTHLAILFTIFLAGCQTGFLRTTNSDANQIGWDFKFYVGRGETIRTAATSIRTNIGQQAKAHCEKFGKITSPVKIENSQGYREWSDYGGSSSYYYGSAKVLCKDRGASSSPTKSDTSRKVKIDAPPKVKFDPPPKAKTDSTVKQQLEQVKDLLKNGLITSSEAEQKRKDILGRL